MQRRVPFWVAGWTAWAVSGCASPAPERLSDPGDRSGEAGSDGPYGAAVLTVRAPARVTEVVLVDLVYPADDDLRPAVRDAPAVVWIAGGAVARERYRWLAVHLASRGVAVAMPEAPLGLALLAPGNGAVALDALRDASSPGGPLPNLVAADGPVGVGGHSLGGVAAARQWTQDLAVDALFLAAAYPAPGDPVETEQRGRPVLVLYGSTDRRLDLVRFDDELARFGGPTFVGEIDGMNHYGWTDDATERELRGDGPARGDLEVQRQAVQHALDVYLDAVFAGDDPHEPLAAVADPELTWR